MTHSPRNRPASATGSIGRPTMRVGRDRYSHRLDNDMLGRIWSRGLRLELRGN